MISKATLKEYASLKEKKYRSSLGKIFIEGKRIVEEALKSSYFCEAIVATESFLNSHDVGFLSSHEIHIVTEKEFRLLSDTQTAQGIGAVLEIPVFDDRIDTLHADCILYFDEIRDPGNAGTMIRTAAWFGIKDIILGRDSVDVFNPKVVRSSMGSIFTMNFIEDDSFYTKLTQARKAGFVVLGAELRGENIFTYTPPEKFVIIMGSEAEGISPALQRQIQTFVTIPKRGTGESLNVGVAASIIIAQLRK
jgi:TrmH family RNA methyltransferase